MFSTLKNIKDFFEDKTGFTINRLTDKLKIVGTSNGLTIPVYHELITGYPLARQFPVIGILPARTEFSEEIENHSFDRKHRVAIVVINGGTQEKQIQDELMLYSDAIVNILQKDPTLNSRIVYTFVSSVDYGEMIQTQKGRETIQAMTVELVLIPKMKTDEIENTGN
jgi:hypothetical protein